MLDLHWRYFLALDEDLAKLSRYIEFDAAHSGVYSLELLRILLGAGAACSVLLKKLSTPFGGLPLRPNIDHFCAILTKEYPKLPNIVVTIPLFKSSCQPWASWNSIPPTHPTWWNAYNEAKHDPNTSFTGANLINTIHACAGLYVLNLAAFKVAGQLEDLWEVPSVVRVAQYPNVMAMQGYALPEIP